MFGKTSLALVEIYFGGVSEWRQRDLEVEFFGSYPSPPARVLGERCKLPIGSGVMPGPKLI